MHGSSADALQRAAHCTIDTVAGQASIPVPDLRGALVLKARAWAADNRDRGRHLYDAPVAWGGLPSEHTNCVAPDNSRVAGTPPTWCASLAACQVDPSG